jgi:hypothetical protein
VGVTFSLLTDTGGRISVANSITSSDGRVCVATPPSTNREYFLVLPLCRACIQRSTYNASCMACIHKTYIT